MTLSVLPRSIWTRVVTPIPGRYDGLFVGQQGILDKVYKLATRGSRYFELNVEGTSMGAMAEHLRTLLERAASKSDFTEVLSSNRNFRM